MSELLLVIVARFPSTGKPTRIMHRRDFENIEELKATINNLTLRAKTVKIAYAGKPKHIGDDRTVVHVEDKFKCQRVA